MTAVFLTDELADVQPATGQYLVAKVGSRSDCCSLVRAVTSTAAGPSSGIQVTRSAGGTALAWITPPLDGTDLAASGNVEAHIWAKESAAAANAALRFQVARWQPSGTGAAFLDDNDGVELGTASVDANLAIAAVVQALADGDRLVFTLLIDDAGTMGANATVTVSYNGQLAKAEGDSYIVLPETIAVTAATPTASATKVRRHLHMAIASADYTVELSADELLQAIGNAVYDYSRDRPLVVTDYLSGDGTTFEHRLPRRWVWGLSRLVEVEYPFDSTAQQNYVLEPNDAGAIERALGGQPFRALRFQAITPESGTDNVLVRYTTRHVHTDETDTIPPDDLEAVLLLAASYGALQMASKRANAADSTIAADSVQHGQTSNLWMGVAKEYRARYDSHINTSGTASAQPGGQFIDWDVPSLPGNIDRLYHPRRSR